jgi:hypothetical protein
MALQNIEKNMPEKLKRRVIDAWQTGHGGQADQVHLLMGEDGLALMIPKALYQAEIDLSRGTTHSTKLLNQYLRTLVDTVSADLLPMVEEFAQQDVEEIVPLVDLRAGWIIAFFRFHKADESE